MAGAELPEDVEEFLQELDGVDVDDSDIHEDWAELDEPSAEGVVSLPDSGTSGDGDHSGHESGRTTPVRAISPKPGPSVPIPPGGASASAPSAALVPRPAAQLATGAAPKPLPAQPPGAAARAGPSRSTATATGAVATAKAAGPRPAAAQVPAPRPTTAPAYAPPQAVPRPAHARNAALNPAAAPATGQPAAPSDRAGTDAPPVSAQPAPPVNVSASRVPGALGEASIPTAYAPAAAAATSQCAEEIKVADGAPNEHEHTQEGRQPAAGSATGGSAWGWLRAAVSDVSDLSTSFAKVLQEAAAESEEEGEDQDTPGTAAQSATAHPQPPADADSPLPPEAELRRREVLARLEGEESRAERAASEAGRALSSLWGWGAQLAHKVEQVAATAAKEIAGTPQEGVEVEGSDAAMGARSAASASEPSQGTSQGRLGDFRLGITLGSLAGQAQRMLERGLTGSSGAARGGRAAQSAVSATDVLLGEGAGRRGEEEEDLGFENCFYIYGGRQELEGLERMSSESARLCNRVRSKLSDAERVELDRTLAALQPILDPSAQHPSDAEEEGQEGDSSDAGPKQTFSVCPREPAALTRGHEVIEELAATGCELADELVAAATELASHLLQMTAPTSETPTDGSSAGVAETAVEASPSTHPDAVRALRRVQGEGTRRVAEVCSLCLERLVALARSVSSWRQTRRPATDGIVWPARSEEIGLLLRRQARRMVGDMQAMTEAFDVALESSGVVLDEQARSKEFSRLAEELRATLATDCEAATAKIHEAGRALLNIVWLNALDATFVGAD